MKTKFSKRLLSLLLSALMVVTSLPLVAIPAFAANAAVTEVENAMKEFEDKLTVAGAAYTNVTQAYNAYVNCQKALDAYIYGGDTTALNGKASALTTAIGKIGTFSGYSTDGSATNKNVWSGDSTSNYELYKNVLWIESPYDADNNNRGTYDYNGKSVTTTIYYPDVTLLYDGGANIPATSVMVVMYGGSSNQSNANRYVYGVSIDGSKGLDLLQNWKRGKDGTTLDHTWNMYGSAWSISKLSSGFNNCSGAERIRKKGITKATAYTYRYSNMMQFTGTMPDTEISREITPTLTSYCGSETAFTNSDIVSAITGSKSIHVINTNALVNQLKTTGESMKSIAVSDYSEGGIASFISVMDEASSFDPNTYFTSSNDYAGCANAIISLISRLKSAPNSNVKNSDDYKAMRTAMSEAVRSQYTSGNTGYTTESWGKFVTAYETAQNDMKAVTTSGYTGETIVADANALTAAFEGLKTNANKVETSSLEAVIDQFEGWTNIFTSESYASVVSVVDAAKAAIWGTADQYKIATSAPDDSTEAQTAVATQVTNVQNALKNLRLSMDTVVELSAGRYSMNTALALTVSDPSDYANYSDYALAVANANDYVSSAATTEFTDYDTQLAAYTAQVKAVVDAYNSLQYSFTKIPDGTVSQVGALSAITQITNSHNDSKYQKIDFSYTPSAVMIKTTHDTKAYPYGNAYVKFATNVSGMDNNMLDSISINANAWNSSTAEFTSGDKTLGDTATYAGCLAYNGFSLSNFRVTEMVNYASNPFAKTADGTAITDQNSTVFDTMLGTTDNATPSSAKGGVFAKSAGGADGSITMGANLNVTPTATAVKALDATTLPTSTTYNLNTTYFGAVHTWEQKVGALSYRGYSIAKSTEQINTYVTVLDISYLVDLVNECNAIVPNAAYYTDATWATFTQALKEAQADMDYTTLSASIMLSRCKDRYTTLLNAKNALAYKTFTITFNYKDAAGADASTVIKNVRYNDVLETGYVRDDTGAQTSTTYISVINGISTPDYISGNYSYAFSEWSPTADLSSPVKADATYTAQYTSTLRNADFTTFNTAKAKLAGALIDDVYTVATLQNLATEISALTYYSYTDQQKLDTMADSQGAIDAETTKLTDLYNALTPAGLDLSAAQALKEQGKYTTDRDVYDMSGYDSAIVYEQTVNVGGNQVKGLVYDTDLELDAAIRSYLNGLSVMTYTVYLDGVPVGTADYGTSVIVDGNGTFNSNVADTEVDYTGPARAWYYSYSAPSTNNTQTDAKYMTSAPSFGFIVKGNTYLTTKDVESSGSGYVVTFVSNAGAMKKFDVVYTDASGNFTMPTAPSYAFYSFTGYDNGLAAGAQGNVAADTTVVANYSVDTSTTYTIKYFESYDFFLGCFDDNLELTGAPSQQYSCNYNELVEIPAASESVYWCQVKVDPETSIDYYTILSIGTSYSFYSCQDINILPLTQSDYETILRDSTQGVRNSATGAYEPSLNADAYDVILDSAGNPILANVNVTNGRITTYPEVTASVSALDNVVPIYNDAATFTKFSMIGTFTLPEGYSMVECGFLFTTTTGTGDITLEKVGTNGIARMKSSRYTVGNQFVVNVKAPSDGSTKTFDYVGYAIIKNNTTNEQSVVYTNIKNATTAGF